MVTHLLKCVVVFSIFLTACTVVPPKNTENLCATFREKQDWYGDAKHSYDRWGVPISVQMAIMNQESHFVADAQPPRSWLLWIIPLPRASSAYGYAQAKDETWEDYQAKAGHWGADRDEFADAIDFIGWYCNISYTHLGISKSDTKNLYLAYHEGHRGYRHKTYLQKAWLLRIADKVARKAKLYQNQLTECQSSLENSDWFF